MQRRWTHVLLLAPLAAHLAFTACAKDDGKREPDASADGSADAAYLGVRAALGTSAG